MKRGLVIGKFMPVHTGHLALINFAATQCDELIVSLSYKATDSIDGTLRFAWLKELKGNDPKIKIEISEDDFDDDTLALPERVQHWATFIKSRFPPIHVVISSELYGEPFALALGASHVMFDLHRENQPVSATLIREHPLQYWNFIPSNLRPYFVKKICFYGPESTGKSTMAELMAAVYNTEYVPEVARELTTSNNFTVDDIISIGKAQTQRVVEKIKTANKILCCDTDLITTQIYSQIYLNEVPSILYELEKQITYDHYFLFDIDVPWVADGLRDLGDRRREMFNVFKHELDKRNLSYEIVRGDWETRKDIVKSRLNAIIDL